MSEFEENLFFLLFSHFSQVHETAAEAGTTVFKKMCISYYRFVVNFSVNFLVALLAQNIDQPKKHLTGATYFSIFFTPIILKIKNHQ